MKRNILFAVRAIPPVVLTCIAVAAVAVAGRMFSAAPDTPTWAAAFNNVEPQRYQNVIVVARSGGDFTSVQEALTSITDNSPTNRYLVWVAPGIYTELVTMKPYVDIEGAGELVTKITYMGSASDHAGTVVGASDAELRSLTVQNTGGNTVATAIYNDNASPSLLHVTAIASGGTNANYAVHNANNSSPTMRDVTASASGASSIAVYNEASSPTMTNVTASAAGTSASFGVGVYNYNSSPTMIDGAITASGANGNRGVNNLTSSPTMIRVRITIPSGGWGVSNVSSSPTMIDVIISVGGGGSTNIGIFSNNGSALTMNGVRATVWGAVTNYGVENILASATIRDSNFSVGGGANNYGVYNTAYSGSYRVSIDNSTLTGSTNTIYNDPHYVTLVGASKLEGGPALPNGGKLYCAGVYDEHYTFFPSTCP